MKGFNSLEHLSLEQCRGLLETESNPERVDEIKGRIKALEEIACHNEISSYRKCSTITDFEGYLANYPNGRFRAECLIKLDDLYFSYYMSTKRGCERYLEKYPKGRHASEARNIISKAKKRRNVIIFIIIAVALACYLGYRPAGNIIVGETLRNEQYKSNKTNLSFCFAVTSLRCLSMPILTHMSQEVLKTLTFSKEGGIKDAPISSNAKMDDIEITCYDEWISVKKTSNGINVTVDENDSVKRTGTITVRAWSTLFGIKTSCSSGFIIIEQEAGDATYLTVSTENITFDDAGGDRTITVDTDYSWSIRGAAASWLNLKKNGNQIIVRANENTSSSSRSDRFTVVSGGKEKVVAITQYGHILLSVSPDNLSFPSSGGSKSISVTASEEWRIGVTTKSWAHLYKTGDHLTVTIDENTSTSSRTDYFTINVRGQEKRINITQSGKQATYLNVSQSNISLSSSGGRRTITVSTDGTWEISVGTASWIDMSRSGNTITLNIENNDGSDDRDDYFKISAGSLEKKVTINQSGDHSPKAEIDRVWVEHNVKRTIFNPVFGWQNYNVMVIHINFTVNYQKGKNIYVAAFFFDENGNSLYTSNNQYRSPNGQITTQSSDTATYENTRWTDFTMEIPCSVFPKGDNKFNVQIFSSERTLLTESSYTYFNVN